VTGCELIAALGGAGGARPPYIPLVGRLAAELGQVPYDVYVTDAQAQAMALAQTVPAIGADGATVGMGTDPAIGCDVAQRVRPLLAGIGIVAVVQGCDVAAARAYCEEGVSMVVVSSPEQGGKLKTFGNACRFYDVPTILFDPALEDPAAVAANFGLSGAFVARPSGDEAVIVGGGLSVDDLGAAAPPPRPNAFFWSFADEIPEATSPERLAELGAALTR
jgi:hypothetical protein